jgi:Mlc titration factor MtfA (ptsG expression regulator)
MSLSAIKLIGFTKRVLAERMVSSSASNHKVEAILVKNLPFFNCLNSVQKKAFIRKVQVFLNSKRFIGMNEFQVNLTHKIIIAALAVRIIFKLGLKYYDHIIRIYLFESEFFIKEFDKFDGITASNGVIGLSWKAVEEGVSNPADGKNVVLHEFAHALDLYDEKFDGIPGIFKSKVIKPLLSGIIQEHDKFLSEWKEWHRFTYKFEVKDISEFFAKSTVLFFENPQLLKEHDQKLYKIMLTIYRYEPLPVRLMPD